MTRKFLCGSADCARRKQNLPGRKDGEYMKHNEQELWNRARRLIRRAQRKLDSVRRDYERIVEMRKELDQLTKSDEDKEF